MRHPLKGPDWLPTLLKTGDATLRSLAFDILVAQGYTRKAALRTMTPKKGTIPVSV